MTFNHIVGGFIPLAMPSSQAREMESCYGSKRNITDSSRSSNPKGMLHNSSRRVVITYELFTFDAMSVGLIQDTSGHSEKKSQRSKEDNRETPQASRTSKSTVMLSTRRSSEHMSSFLNLNSNSFQC